MNRVFDKNGVELTPAQMANEANAISKNKPFKPWDFDVRNPTCRISGTGHCACGGDGEFVLLPANDPDVIQGGKRYMQCRKCGGWSHL